MAEQSGKNTGSRKPNIIECMRCINKVSLSVSQTGGQQYKKSGVSQDNAANWMYSKKCPHRLCDHCFTAVKSHEGGKAGLNCKFCQTKHSQYTDFVQDYIEWQWKREKDLREQIMLAYNMRREDFSSEEAYNAYLEQREDMIQDSLEDRNLEEIQRKINQHKKHCQRQTDQANQKQQEIKENLVVIIKCENARLNFNFYERKSLLENINIEEKEKASKLLENLKLDKLEEQLTNNAVQQKFDEEDAEMIVETQKGGKAAPGIQRLLGIGHSHILEQLQIEVENQKPTNIVVIQDQREREKILMEAGGVRNQGKAAAQQRSAKMFLQGLKKH